MHLQERDYFYEIFFMVSLPVMQNNLYNFACKFQVYRKSDQDEEYISGKKSAKPSKNNNASQPLVSQTETLQADQVYLINVCKCADLKF